MQDQFHALADFERGEALRDEDGIVKGLKAPDWPIQPWPALHRLAMQLAQVGAATHPPGSRTPR
jgi:hypothetical protein